MANFSRVIFAVVVLNKGVVFFPSSKNLIDFGVGVIFVEKFDPGFETSTGFDL